MLNLKHIKYVCVQYYCILYVIHIYYASTFFSVHTQKDYIIYFILA